MSPAAVWASYNALRCTGLQAAAAGDQTELYAAALRSCMCVLPARTTCIAHTPTTPSPCPAARPPPAPPLVCSALPQRLQHTARGTCAALAPGGGARDGRTTHPGRHGRTDGGTRTAGRHPRVPAALRRIPGLLPGRGAPGRTRPGAADAGDAGEWQLPASCLSVLAQRQPRADARVLSHSTGAPCCYTVQLHAKYVTQASLQLTACSLIPAVAGPRDAPIAVCPRRFTHSCACHQRPCPGTLRRQLWRMARGDARDARGSARCGETRSRTPCYEYHAARADQCSLVSCPYVT